MPAIHLEAVAGRAPSRAHPALRVGVTNLTLNHLHCCVERALPVPSVAAWIEREVPVRLPVDRVGTVDRLVFDQLLEHFGISEAAIVGRGGALIPAMNYDEQLALYARGEVNALWQFMGIPSPSDPGRPPPAPTEAAAVSRAVHRDDARRGLDGGDDAGRRLRRGRPAGTHHRDGDLAGVSRERRRGRGARDRQRDRRSR
jgi:hypothetical protein